MTETEFRLAAYLALLAGGMDSWMALVEIESITNADTYKRLSVPPDPE